MSFPLNDSIQLALRTAVDSSIDPWPVDDNDKANNQYRQGWNDALKTSDDRNQILARWAGEELTKKQTEAVVSLCRDGWLYFIFNEDEKPIPRKSKKAFQMHILLNDIFGPGSDTEEITTNELVFVAEMVNKFSYYGIGAYYSEKRKQDPWNMKESEKPKYEMAKNYIRKKKLRAI